MTDVPGWKLATYSPGDEVGILRLFKQVFKVERNLDRWNWEYADNRAGKFHIMLAKNSEREVIGHLSSIPVFVKYYDRQYIFGHGVDFMVRSDYRGKQKGAYLFIQLIHKYMDEFVGKDGEAVLLGVPNEVAFRTGTLSKFPSPFIPLSKILFLTKNVKSIR